MDLFLESYGRSEQSVLRVEPCGNEANGRYILADSSISCSERALFLLPIPVLRSPYHFVVESDGICVRTVVLVVRNWSAGCRRAMAKGIFGIIDLEGPGGCLGCNVYLGHERMWVGAYTLVWVGRQCQRAGCY